MCRLRRIVGGLRVNLISSGVRWYRRELCCDGKCEVNAFNQLEIEGEPLLESCDECNALIVNWETLTNSFLTFDNRVVCRKCLKKAVDFPKELL